MAGDKYKLDVVALTGNAREVFATERIRMNRPWDDSVGLIRSYHALRDPGWRDHADGDFPVEPFAWERFYTPPSI